MLEHELRVRKVLASRAQLDLDRVGPGVVESLQASSFDARVEFAHARSQTVMPRAVSFANVPPSAIDTMCCAGVMTTG